VQILITGVAGFVGFHLARRLLKEGMQVQGVDNLNFYYDVSLKQARLQELRIHPGFTFHYFDLWYHPTITSLFEEYTFDYVVHLAAQPGVRYSQDHPIECIKNNLVVFTHILKVCCQHHIRHFIFASSSSVYGSQSRIPFQVEDHPSPVSLYGITKRLNELMAYRYSCSAKTLVTGLRFFTIYGPWGRPDMAYFKFVKAIEAGAPIDLYNFGQMKRDFTYIDDVIEAIIRILFREPISDSLYKIYNIGSGYSTDLLSLVSTIEAILGKVSIKRFLPGRSEEILITQACLNTLKEDTGFIPSTSIDEGMQNFIGWYQNYSREKNRMISHYPKESSL
jgi:UDP-glucuronate 4-epimerase